LLLIEAYSSIENLSIRESQLHITAAGFMSIIAPSIMRMNDAHQWQQLFIIDVLRDSWFMLMFNQFRNEGAFQCFSQKSTAPPFLGLHNI
jgi:hypothetical protein